MLAIVVLVRFDPGGARYQLTESHAWVKDFGVRYDLGVDGIAVVLVALTALLIPFVMLAGWHDADPRRARRPNASPRRGQAAQWRPTQGFFALILLVEAMVVLSFEATDVFLFYIFFEAMLIPMYFLIGGFGDRAHAGGEEEAARQRSYAAVKFLLYNLVGGLIMLAAVIGLYAATAHQLGTGTFSLQEILARPSVRQAAHGDLHRALAVPRLLLRLRGEGAAVAAAHLAAERDGRGHRPGRGADHRGRRQGRHLRDAALLPPALPGGVQVGHAGHPRAGASSASSTARCSPSASATSSG